MALPEISFVETDTGNIESAIITTYEALAGRTLAQGDPIRLFLLSVAAIIVQQRVLIDYSAKMNLLAYAEGDYLDHIGNLVGVTRLPSAAAITTLRFTLSAAQPQVVTIPAGTRAATESGVVFATDAAAEVAAGSVYVDVAATCTQAGDAGNGYLAGQINKTVDPVAYVASVANTTESEGGAEIEADDALRERIQQAPESFSVAGPTGAYEYWAKTASSLITDVAVYTPSPGNVVIRPLLSGGELPGTEILEAVFAVCNASDIRPLTDNLSVLAPEAVDYDISLTYYINRADATSSVAIQAAVTAAVNAYALWQKSKLGRDINPAELIYRIRAAGAGRVEVTRPIYTALESYQVATADNVAVTFGGLIDG